MKHSQYKNHLQSVCLWIFPLWLNSKFNKTVISRNFFTHFSTNVYDFFHCYSLDAELHNVFLDDEIEGILLHLAETLFHLSETLFYLSHNWSKHVKPSFILFFYDQNRPEFVAVVAANFKINLTQPFNAIFP